MAIDDLQRRHWMMIGAAVGIILGLGQLWGGNEPLADLPSIGAREFEEGLRASPRDGAPVLDRITVYPAAAGEPDLVILDRRTDWGLFARLAQRDAAAAGKRPNPREVHYVLHRFYARKPFKPEFPVPGASMGPGYTVRDYLKDLARSGEAPHATFRYAWWKEPKTAFALWTAGSILLIGVVWPTVLNLLVGAGFGRRAPEGPDYDLSRFKSKPEPATKPAAAPAPGALEDHVRQLEEHLAGALSPGVPAAGHDQPAAPVPTLVAAPAETVAAHEEAAKAYQGEFYPVVKPPHHDEAARAAAGEIVDKP